MKLLISILTTNFSQLKKHWQKHSVLLRKKGKRGSNVPFKGNMEGMVIILDTNTGKIIKERKLNSPSGMVIYKSKVFVNSINKGIVYILDKKTLEIVGKIKNPLLCKPHSIVKTKRGFLITSTALDTIIEVNNKGKTLWKFCFVDNDKYKLDQLGKRRLINWKLNHNKIIYPSLTHTTHVNFAKFKDKNNILATLFHTGELVEINIKNKKIRTIKGNLGHPHGFHSLAKNKNIIVDTSNNRLIVTDKNFNELYTIFGDYSWIQSIAVNKNNIYISDADNHRIVKIDKVGVKQKEYSFSKEYRLFEIIKYK